MCAPVLANPRTFKGLPPDKLDVSNPEADAVTNRINRGKLSSEPAGELPAISLPQSGFVVLDPHEARFGAHERERIDLAKRGLHFAL